MNNFESLEQLTLAVESAGVDIAPSYTDYLRLALAIATDCGEQGRDCFHRLCRLHSDYDSTKTDRMFDHVLKSHQNRVHLGTAFHLASVAGVDVKGIDVPPFEGKSALHILHICTFFH